MIVNSNGCSAGAGCFSAMTSMIPNKHDYFTHYMGESNVIVQRDGAGRVRAYLNKCRHRGNLVCPYDRGNARNFSCAYHGWVYSDGRLTGVPFSREAYSGAINMGEWGLVEVPRLASFGGLIFGSWIGTRCRSTTISATPSGISRSFCCARTWVVLKSSPDRIAICCRRIGKWCRKTLPGTIIISR